MGTKTVDETGVKTDEHKTDEAADAAEATEAPESIDVDRRTVEL